MRPRVARVSIALGELSPARLVEPADTVMGVNTVDEVLIGAYS